MKNNQNVILAIVLSFAVLMGWNYFVTGPQLEAERQRQAAEEIKTADAAPGTVGGAQAPGTQAPGTQAPAPSAAVVPVPPAAPASDAAGPAVPRPVEPSPAPDPLATAPSREAVIAAGQRVRVETSSLIGSINLKGGRIDDLLLTGYHVTVDRSSPLVELFSPAGTEFPYFAEFGWVASAGGPAVPGPDTLWTADNDILKPGQPLTLSWDNGAGLVFQRTIAVDQNFMFTIDQGVENATGAPVTLHPYGIVSRTGRPNTAGYYILHEGLIGFLGDDGLQEINYDDRGGLPFMSKRNLEEEPTITLGKTSSGWLGITDKYWAAALIPNGGEPFQPRFIKGAVGPEPSFQADYLGAPVTVPAAGSATSETRLFAGAKETRLLDQYSAELGIPQFTLLIDWGWFWFITQPMFKLIDWLYRLLGNFGLAILAVTVIVKAVFFPLANRSYTSMSKMKKLQPQMQQLQERFKDDRAALQKGMMDLYKTEKVNPVAGCWPILIQIPVFFSLYKALFVTIEMRHAPFFGWIRDLSAPDPSNLFTLFGLIPWDPPQLLHLGIWPLIMGLTMFVQMRMNPTPPDKTQAMIFNWMPVFFTFMLAGFPAGLVIYWAWNNLLSVIQQGVIMKRNGVPIELFGNLKNLVARPKPKDNPAE